MALATEGLPMIGGCQWKSALRAVISVVWELVVTISADSVRFSCFGTTQQAVTGV
uniref:hypothetical protein n=1 Tax=Candidatus Vondammii sp. HM_W22 TaxID=2687299 RepID=UPI001F13760D|nr:hypothetical protein [Candidatus Vondammii sp. HM_W22]